MVEVIGVRFRTAGKIYFFNPKEFQVILAKNPTDYKVYTLEELFPGAFSANDL